MSATGRRIRLWWGFHRAAGKSRWKILSREAPRTVFRSFGRAIGYALNRNLLLPLYDDGHGVSIRQALARAGGRPFFLICVPGKLHYILPCLTLVNSEVPIVLVSNGLRPWEEALIRDRFPRLPMVGLHRAPGTILPHGMVLDILIRHASRHLGILDYDTFVFEPSIFDELTLREREFAAGAFGWMNPKAGFTIPRTHLLVLDCDAARTLSTRYQVSANQMWRTPPYLVKKLSRLTHSHGQFLKEGLPFFDTLDALMALALQEGYQLRVARPNDHVVHIGGVTWNESTVHVAYVNHRLLSSPSARAFARRYRPHPPSQLQTMQLRARLVAACGLALVDRIDETIDRLAKLAPV